MKKDLKEKVNNLIFSVVGTNVSQFDENKKFNEIPGWDSFNTLVIISRFQEEFHIEFNPSEIERAQKLKDLFDLIDLKLKN